MLFLSHYLPRALEEALSAVAAHWLLKPCCKWSPLGAACLLNTPGGRGVNLQAPHGSIWFRFGRLCGNKNSCYCILMHFWKITALSNELIHSKASFDVVPFRQVKWGEDGLLQYMYLYLGKAIIVQDASPPLTFVSDWCSRKFSQYILHDICQKIFNYLDELQDKSRATFAFFVSSTRCYNLRFQKSIYLTFVIWWRVVLVHNSMHLRTFFKFLCFTFLGPAANLISSNKYQVHCYQSCRLTF